MKKWLQKHWNLIHLTKEEMSTLLRVDHEQYKALRYALTHNLTLVNGEYLRVMNALSHLKPIVVVTS